MKRKLKYSNIILVIIALIILCVNLIIYMNKYLVSNYNANDKDINISDKIEASTTKEKTQEEKDAQELKKIQTMNERDRMQYYFGKYIGYIQEETYGEAYNLLYDEFQDTYFPTYNEYVEYIREKYPFELIAVEYNNIERNGDIYVLWVSIVDPINGNPTSEDKLEQKIVIKENDFNDFVLSFSVDMKEEK